MTRILRPQPLTVEAFKPFGEVIEARGVADSINYAIEALRDLVTTIKDSSILVDAASKQTEGPARQLLRAGSALP